MKNNWDPNDHQGKSRKNVETSYRILLGSIIIGTVLGTWILIYKLIKMIF